MQKLIQTQNQQQVQQQRLSQQQMLQVKLLEMPLTELEQNINAELDDNPALEERRDDTDMMESGATVDENTDREDELYEEKTEREEREEALDNALESLGSDDELPSPKSHFASASNPDADYEEIVWGDTTSFYDKLKEQMGEVELTDSQRDIMEYLIGSLDNDGLLRKNLNDIADELAIYHNIDVPESEIETVLKRLQSFDPAGIGARNLQECLLLQIERKPAGRLRELMEEVIEKHFDEFTKKHWDRIVQSMQLSPDQAEIIQKEIRKLNPKPGSSLGETQGRNLQQITPDFIVDTDVYHQSWTNSRPKNIVNILGNGRYLSHKSRKHESPRERSAAICQRKG